MFNSQFTSDKKLELTKVWVAANWFYPHKLKKSDVDKTNVKKTIAEILHSKKSLTLWLASKLLLGVTRIHTRKGEFLYSDSNNVLSLLTQRQKPPVNAKTLSNQKRKQNRHQSKSRLRGNKGESDEDIIMRSSQKKIGRFEDIYLPEGLRSLHLAVGREFNSHIHNSDTIVPVRERRGELSPIRSIGLAQPDFIDELPGSPNKDSESSIELTRRAADGTGFAHNEELDISESAIALHAGEGKDLKEIEDFAENIGFEDLGDYSGDLGGELAEDLGADLGVDLSRIEELGKVDMESKRLELFQRKISKEKQLDAAKQRLLVVDEPKSLSDVSFYEEGRVYQVDGDNNTARKAKNKREALRMLRQPFFPELLSAHHQKDLKLNEKIAKIFQTPQNSVKNNYKTLTESQKRRFLNSEAAFRALKRSKDSPQIAEDGEEDFGSIESEIEHEIGIGGEKSAADMEEGGDSEGPQATLVLSDSSNDSSTMTTDEILGKKKRFSRTVLEATKRVGANGYTDFKSVSKGCSRKTVAKTFCELLNLSSSGLLKLKQEKSLGPITISTSTELII